MIGEGFETKEADGRGDASERDVRRLAVRDDCWDIEIMALIERHPDVEDYFVEMSLADIKARGGVADLFEEGQLILINDYRLDFDFGAL